MFPCSRWILCVKMIKKVRGRNPPIPPSSFLWQVLTSVNKGPLMSDSDTLLYTSPASPQKNMRKKITLTSHVCDVMYFTFIWWYNDMFIPSFHHMMECKGRNEDYADDSLLWRGRLKWGFPLVGEFEIDRVFLLPGGRTSANISDHQSCPHSQNPSDLFLHFPKVGLLSIYNIKFNNNIYTMPPYTKSQTFPQTFSCIRLGPQS